MKTKLFLAGLLNTILLIALPVILPAQTQVQYLPEKGMTIYRHSGKTTIYRSEGGGTVSTRTADGRVEQHDCKEDEKACREALEEAADDLPQQPGGGEEAQSLPPLEQRILSEFRALSISGTNRGTRVWFRTHEGKWSEVQSWAELHQRNLATLGKPAKRR